MENAYRHIINEDMDYEISFGIESSISQALYEIIMIEYSGFDLHKFLEEQGICHIAIYCMGRVGKALLEMLIRHGAVVKYCYDKDEITVIEGVKVIHDVYEDAGEVDLILVTSEQAYPGIKSIIEMKNDCLMNEINHSTFNCHSYTHHSHNGDC